jgi:DNA polymerase III alpha subunit (gram-positive type)
MKPPQTAIRPVSDQLYEVVDLDIEDLSRLRLWIFDLEASGLDTTRERITQVAGIPIEGGRILEEQAFTAFVNPGPGVEISQEVQDLTGITPDMLVDAPSLPKVWQACVEASNHSDLWIGQSVFEFDVPLLETEFERHRMSTSLPPILDSVVMATALLGEPENRWSTSALVQKFEVNTDGLRRHDALDDVKILARILIPMLKRFKRCREDRLRIRAEEPLRVKRHPPIRSESS